MTTDEALEALKAAAVEYAPHNNDVGLDFAAACCRLTEAAMGYALAEHRARTIRETHDG